MIELAASLPGGSPHGLDSDGDVALDAVALQQKSFLQQRDDALWIRQAPHRSLSRKGKVLNQTELSAFVLRYDKALGEPRCLFDLRRGRSGRVRHQYHARTRAYLAERHRSGVLEVFHFNKRARA
jgi:hypothetical protein